MAKTWRRPSPFTKRKFKPYAEAMGQLALAWTDLHEALGDLYFDTLSNHDNDPVRNLQIASSWGALASDRQKRNVLEAAVQWIDMARRKECPNFQADVKWLLTRANSLEDRRNDALHSALQEVDNARVAELMGLKVGDVAPVYTIMNHRSAKLAATTWRRGRPLLADLRLYRDYASALAYYVRQVRTAWQRRGPWPERPPLPPLPEGSKNHGRSSARE